MTRSCSVDVIVLGAGLAGMSVADAVLADGRSCAVVDPGGAGAGASGAPAMLANPATGRRARITWHAEDCFDHLTSLLNRVADCTKQSFFEQTGVLRPALTRELARNFDRSPEKYNWPKDWIRRMPRKEMETRHPYLGTHYGGLYVSRAYTVSGKRFATFFLEYLKQQNCIIKTGARPETEYRNGLWELRLNGSHELSAPVLVDATGYGQVRSGRWNFLPLHPVKGQTATFFFDSPLPLQNSVSSLGYIAFLSSTPDQITVGSTYEHTFANLKPDPDGLTYLKKKLETTLPGYARKSISIQQWASVRISTDDKKPVIGAHPSQRGLYIIGALGSKGLLMSRYLASLLVQHIYKNRAIPEPVAIKRFI